MATELELALPHDLTAAQRKELLTDYVTHIVERYGVAADVAIHEPGDGKDHRNIHAHVLITHRELDADGFGDVSNARTVTKKVKGVEKDVTIYGIAANPEDVKAIRSEWEQHVNLAYERAGLDIRIDHRSHADRGIEQEPTKHLGPAATGMERRGEASDRGDINRDIEERNAALRERAALEIAATKAQAELAAARQLVEMERAAEIARRAEQAIQEARRAAQGRTDDTRPDRAGIDRQAEQAMQAAHAATKGRTEEIRAEPAAPIFDREAAEAAWQKQIIDAAAAQAEQEARAAAKGRTDDMRPDRAADIDRQAEQAEQEARVAARGRTDDIRAPDALRSHEVQPEPATEIRTPSPLDLDLELGEAVDSGMKAAGGLSASFARAIETVLSGIFSFFDSGPKLTPDQAERQARSNAEQQEERARQEAEAEQAAAQDRVLAEQLRQAAREREEEERFRRIMRDAAREDRGYERERERER